MIDIVRTFYEERQSTGSESCHENRFSKNEELVCGSVRCKTRPNKNGWPHITEREGDNKKIWWLISVVKISYTYLTIHKYLIK